MACSVLTIRQYHSTSLRRSPGINFVKLIFHRQKSGKKGREPVIGDVEILQLLLELLEAAEGEAEEPIPGDAKVRKRKASVDRIIPPKFLRLQRMTTRLRKKEKRVHTYQAMW
jgi:hypothetical protein